MEQFDNEVNQIADIVFQEIRDDPDLLEEKLTEVGEILFESVQSQPLSVKRKQKLFRGIMDDILDGGS